MQGMVAQLKSSNTHKGTAWLINNELAVTALHCVQDIAGIEYSNLKILFPATGANITVKVLNKVPHMDIAVLEIEPHEYDNLPLIQLSRAAASSDLDCTMSGYPGAVVDVVPGGISIPGRVEEVVPEYNGVKHQLNCKVFQIKSSVSSGDQNNQLQGLSGGPLVINNARGKAAIGVVIEYLLGKVYAVPIADIALEVPAVKKALDESQHIDEMSNQLHISLSEDGKNILWSSIITPNEVAKLWEASGVVTTSPSKVAVNEFHIDTPLRKLRGVASQALLRFCAYSEGKVGYVNDSSQWYTQLQKLDELHRPPTKMLSLKEYDPALSLHKPSSWNEYPVEEFSKVIHHSLDSFLLVWLDDKLYNCLEEDENTELGCFIHKDLGLDMYSHWTSWHDELKANPDLLQQYLIRVFSLDSECVASHGILMSIGSTPQIRRQLLHATLFALALCASGVNMSLAPLDSGNISVQELPGHVCGVEQSQRRRIDMIAGKHEWNTDVIILPYLTRQLLHTFQITTPLTSTEGTKGHHFQFLPPIAITGEMEFLCALEAGKESVKKYYDERRLEIENVSNDFQLPARTGALDV
ncbi:ABC-three component system protein [Vibrio splendidus]